MSLLPASLVPVSRLRVLLLPLLLVSCGPKEPAPDSAPPPLPVPQTRIVREPARPSDPAQHPRPGTRQVTVQEVAAPPHTARFQEWLQRYQAADPATRERLLPEGRGLLGARRKEMAQLIATDPRAAVLLALPPAVRRGLPPDFESELETLVMGEGMYIVAALCNHGPDQPHDQGCTIRHQAYLDGATHEVSIYGTRGQRLTEENASLFGVRLDGRIALHEDDIVVLPGSAAPDAATAGPWEVIYKGRSHPAATPAAVDALVAQLTGGG